MAMRFYAAQEILDADKSDQDAISVLEGFIQNHSKYEPGAIVNLGSAGPAAKSAIPEIMAALDSTNAMSLIEAPQALVKLGAPRSSFLPKLEQLLGSGDDAAFKHADARLEFAGKILEIDPANREAQLAVVRMLEGEQNLSTFWSDASGDPISVLEMTKPPIKEVIPALKEAMQVAKKKGDRDYADSIAEAIEQIEANEKEK